MSQKQDLDILSLIELARTNKYEKTVAGFAILDKLEKIPLPKKVRTMKPAAQAIYALANEIVQYNYFTKEEKEALIKEAAKSDAPYKKFSGLFGSSSAPVIEEDTEEEYIPEEEAKAPLFETDDEESGYSQEFVAEEDEEEDDDEDEDDDDDDSDDVEEEDEKEE